MKEVWVVMKDNYIIEIFETEVRALRKALALKVDPGNQYAIITCYKYEVS